MITKKYRKILLSLVFCVWFCVSIFHIPLGKYYTDYTFSEVKILIKKDRNSIVYFARDDCSECKRIDKLLIKNNGNLKTNVYRIETRSDPSKLDLRFFLQTNRIEKVPTFWSAETKSVVKVQTILKD